MWFIIYNVYEFMCSNIIIFIKKLMTFLKIQWNFDVSKLKGNAIFSTYWGSTVFKIKFTDVYTRHIESSIKIYLTYFISKLISVVLMK